MKQGKPSRQRTAPVNSSRFFSRWPSAEELRADADAELELAAAAHERVEEGASAAEVVPPRTFRSHQITAERGTDAPNQKFVEMGRKSGEARRAKKAARTADTGEQPFLAELERLSKEYPIVRALAKTASGAEFLAKLSGFASQLEERQPVIVFLNPFWKEMQPSKPEEWLQLLDEGDLDRLRIELEMHAHPPKVAA